MIGKMFVRLLGAVVCVAVVSAGWDAEAGHRHRRCCAPSCCTPVCSYDPCCTPVYETVVTPSCCTTVASCCGPVSYTTVVREAVIAPAACCASTVTTAETVASRKAVAPAENVVSATR